MEVRGRSISPSQKRDREGEWQKVEKQNIRKAKKTIRKTEVGTSAVDFSEIGTAAQAGPIQYYIGNTNGSTEKESIKAILIRCAASLNQNIKFDVIDVDLLTTEPNPRSKCWKVVVPHTCRELMDMPAMFPPGWRHRRFYGGGAPRGIRTDKRQKVTEVRTAESIQMEVEEEQNKVQEEQKRSREELARQHGVEGAAALGVPTGSA